MRDAVDFCMTREQVKEVLDRVLTWPPERQEDAVEILKAVEEQDASELRLTEEQRAEVQRRRTKNDPNRIPFREAFKRFYAR
jgi:hypothetical protein